MVHLLKYHCTLQHLLSLTIIWDIHTKNSKYEGELKKSTRVLLGIRTMEKWLELHLNTKQGTVRMDKQRDVVPSRANNLGRDSIYMIMCMVVRLIVCAHHDNFRIKLIVLMIVVTPWFDFLMEQKITQFQHFYVQLWQKYWAWVILKGISNSYHFDPILHWFALMIKTIKITTFSRSKECCIYIIGFSSTPIDLEFI